MIRPQLAGLLPLLLTLALVLTGANADRDIAQRLQARVARSVLRAEPMRVRVANGVAVLEGSVRNTQRKGLATRIAKESGASSVVNLLKINDGRPQEPLKVVRVLP